MADKRDRRKRVHYAPNMANCRASNARQIKLTLKYTSRQEDVTCKRCLHYLLTETGRAT